MFSGCPSICVYVCTCMRPCVRRAKAFLSGLSSTSSFNIFEVCGQHTFRPFFRGPMHQLVNVNRYRRTLVVGVAAFVA